MRIIWRVALATLVTLSGTSVSAWGQQARSANMVYDTSLYDGLRYRMVGPYRGGRSSAIAGVPGAMHTFLMGTTGGGVWKTTDAGQRWVNISDGFFGGSIGAVAIAGADPNVIYVGTGSADIRGNTSTGRGLYKSTDAGKTWNFQGLAETGQIARVVVHPNDPDLVYVAALGHPFGKNAERGIYRSRDGGATWQHVLVLNDSTGASSLAMNPTNPRELFAGMWRGERKPWTLRSGGPEGGVYKSTDGGETWTKLAGGLPGGIVGKVGVDVSGANPDRVWAIVQAEPDGGLYRSEDAGKTWKRVNSENKLRQRAFYYTHVRADPRDENTVFVLNTRLHKSVDGGSTFEVIEVPHGDVHDLWINPAHHNVMAVADDGGGQVTVNGGASWSTYHNQPTAELYDVIVDNGFPYRLYGAQQDNTTISVPAWTTSNTLHAKEHWYNVGGCETGPLALHPDRPDVIYGGCYGGVIDRYDLAKDQRRYVSNYPQLQVGEAGKNLKYRFQWVSPIVVSPHDPDVVYHASQFVHVTRDGGMSWETISPDLTTNNPEHQDFSGGPIDHDITGVEIYNTIFALAVSPHASDVLWAGTDDGRIHVTRDHGGTWSEVTPRGLPPLATVDEIDLSVHQPGRAFVAAHRYRLDDFKPYVFRTDDYGRSWQLLTNGTNGIPAGFPVRTVREDPERRGLVYAGTEFGVFVSFNDGRNWQPLQMNLPVTPITGMRVHGGDLVLATQGRSFWILDDVTPLRELSAEVAGASVHLYGPRDAHRVNAEGSDEDGESPEALPGNALFHYYLATEPSDEVTLEIVDSSGRVARRFTSDSARAAEEHLERIPAKAGTNRATWDLTYHGPTVPDSVVVWGYTGGVKAPPGTYQARLTVASAAHTRSFRVLKDPRLSDVTQEDFEQQFALGSEIRDTIDAIYDGLRTVRSVKQQVGSVAKRAVAGGFGDDLDAFADTVVGNLAAVEKQLTQTRNQSNQDPLRYPPQIDNQYITLYGYVTGTDGYIYGGPEGRPTAGAFQRFADLNTQWSTLRNRVREVVDREVAAFNQRLQALGVPGVILPRDAGRQTSMR